MQQPKQQSWIMLTVKRKHKNIRNPPRTSGKTRKKDFVAKPDGLGECFPEPPRDFR